MYKYNVYKVSMYNAPARCSVGCSMIVNSRANHTGRAPFLVSTGGRFMLNVLHMRRFMSGWRAGNAGRGLERESSNFGLRVMQLHYNHNQRHVP